MSLLMDEFDPGSGASVDFGTSADFATPAGFGVLPFANGLLVAIF